MTGLQTLETNVMRRTRYGMLRALSKSIVQGKRHWLIITVHGAGLIPATEPRQSPGC